MYSKNNTPPRPYSAPITEVIEVRAEQCIAASMYDTLSDMDNNEIFDEIFDEIL